MKRTRRWVLIFTALVGLMAHAGALRASSLLYGKQSTTTKTTTSAPTTTSTEAPVVEETTVAEVVSSDSSESGKRQLTGIPQIDYVWDPNLPRELNGHNLSDYPFFSNVPPEKDIGFKCDGLHDGFYASIKHKCQVYHHCIYGIRHDFLCANFTAFDQRTFICHFVNNVDCKNSAKYWFRNDALYKATTTPSTTTTSTAPPPTQAARPFRRPLRRRRPADYYYEEDYEDDYYEERVNRRQKQRPRQRRPEYDDEYDEDRYAKRPRNRDRNRGDADDFSRDRRPNERPIDRSADKPIERPVAADRPRNRNRPSEARRDRDEDRAEPPRKTANRRRPADDLPPAVDERKLGGSGARRFSTDDRRTENRQSSKASEDNQYSDTEVDRRPIGGRRRPGGQRRPIVDDDIDDRPLRREEPIQEPVKEPEVDDIVDEKFEVAPPPRSGSSSIYGRPRSPPKIAPPVPINERKKFGFPTTKKSITPAPLYDDEYYDDYEDPAPPKKILKDDKFQDSISSQRDSRRPYKAPQAIKEDPKTRYETVASVPDLDDYEEVPAKSSRYKQSDRSIYKSNPTREEAFREDEVRTLDTPPLKSSNRNSYYDRNTDADLDRQRYKEDDREEINEKFRDSRPLVRVVKRPFLPSRGGSPYLPRGLQPVGLAQTSTTTESTSIDMGSTVSGVRLLEHGPPIVRSKVDPEDYPPPRQGPRTTQQPQIDQQRSALDEIYDSEYDVTLNDALNPTLKPIARGLPSGFSHSSQFRLPASGTGSSFPDSLYSSTDRRSSVVPATAHTRTSQSRRTQTYYDEYDY